MIGKILDENIKRSNTLSGWESPPMIEYKYWDIRYEFPERITDPLSLINYIAENYANINVDNLKQNDIFSFYFWVKDELSNIFETEINHLTSRTKAKSKYTPSERSKDFSALMELHQLAGKDLELRRKYKEAQYQEVFEILLAMVIESEGTFKE